MLPHSIDYVFCIIFSFTMIPQSQEIKNLRVSHFFTYRLSSWRKALERKRDENGKIIFHLYHYSSRASKWNTNLRIISEKQWYTLNYCWLAEVQRVESPLWSTQRIHSNHTLKWKVDKTEAFFAITTTNYFPSQLMVHHLGPVRFLHFFNSSNPVMTIFFLFCKSLFSLSMFYFSLARSKWLTHGKAMKSEKNIEFFSVTVDW